MIMVDYLIFQTIEACFLVLFVILEIKGSCFSNCQKMEQINSIFLSLVMVGRERDGLTKEFVLRSLVGLYPNFIRYCSKTFITLN